MTKISKMWKLLFVIMFFFVANVQAKDIGTEKMLNDRMEEETQRTIYRLDIDYNDNNATVTGKLDISIPNQSDKTLKEAFFHLYPNAFSNWTWEQENKPVTKGWLKINEVRANHHSLLFHQTGTLLKVNLTKPLNPNGIVEMEIDFTLKIPQNGLRLNHVNSTVFLAQWYPVLAMYDDEGWHLDPYTTTGDPFFSAVSDYFVDITLPKGYLVASTAVDKDGIITEHKQNLTLSQKNVRDFALLITKDYQKLSGYTKNNTKVNLFYMLKNQEVAGLLTGAGIEAMDFFNQAFGEYPLEEIDIILTDASYKVLGMEYPGIVTSVAEITKKNNGNEKLPAYNVVAHELAHQWWYGVVGNDQVKEPWLDEGLTSFSEYLFMNERMHAKHVKERMEKVKEYTDLIAKDQKIHVLQSIYTYKDDFYGFFVYARPAAMLWNLKEQYGEEKILKIMQTYYDHYKFKIAKTEDFKKVVTDVLGKDMTDFFDDWLMNIDRE